MNELQKVFNYQEQQVRTVVKNGEPWFVAKDVCDVLGITDARKSVNLLDEDERNSVPVTDSLGRNQETLIINEPGLYSLILRSRKPEAKQFKRWITHEVIPTIRKTGGYVANDDLFIQTYLPFADDQTKLLFSATLETVRKQNEVISEMKPKAEEHDRFISATNVQTLEQAAKSIGIGRNKLTSFLRTIGVFVRKEGSPVPYQRYINEGYFKVKQSPSRYYGVNFVQTYVTAKGVSFIDRKLEEYGGARVVNALRIKEIKQKVQGDCRPIFNGRHVV
ncbi:phage antirepressor [Bacillus paralicheniformis]|uniref:phage antirepressor n=1 Tax=Bacillus paralicheniformis TaxID=1648923 RepID=UPI002243C137|nr:phage antirepressor [Bacillus paralicheniformis]MEC1023554.1 phage antirepressor [Bacillus paralicheniformis]MEC1027422.1 phage antirepressor [Bacillus paralicheniformis]MEC1034386.1 phage antirepressor [Bacillus paralicheniformis]MEC1050232.1 phage antirepressor [Bacillus paralicheniformis]MEC1059831.1 phage antirepressor [Bacillus paralicheniformis]